MKKILALIAGILAFSSAALADNDRAVTLERLPAKARTFIMENFPDARLAYAKQERDFLEVHYEVVLVSGVKLEFDRRGEWTGVECRYSTLDKNIIPEPIRAAVEKLYPGTEYRKISRDRREYEVKLTYGLELTFDRDFNLMGIDD